MPPTTRFHTCPLCEATCGIAVTVEDDQVREVRGDPDDAFSQGYICPKAHGLIGLHADPDRLRVPVVRDGGALRDATWDEAFARAVDGIAEIRARHGDDAVAIYLGNPSVHSLDAMLYGQALLRALNTRQRYSASSADQLPKMLSAALMFGGGLTIPIPDVDRTQRLLILGANPLVSNGSLLTAPDMRRRLDAIVARGGQVVVLDPRRTETAARATEHHFLTPGTDALALLAIVHTLFDEGLVKLGRVEPFVRGTDEVRAIAARFAPERVAARCGIAADTLRRLARDHAAAPSAACYGRIGTTCQEFGSLASWAVDLVNVLTGNLDREGGAMFPSPVALPGRYRTGAKPVRVGRYRSSVGGLPEMFGELPVVALADEIEHGPVRAIVTIAGNPLASAPNAARLTRAFERLELRVAVDPYVNETTRLADVILPPPPPLARVSYDLALYQLAVREVARFSTPAVACAPGQPAEWEILLTLAKGAMKMAHVPLAMADDAIARELATRELADAKLGATLDEVLGAIGVHRGPTRLVDLLVRVGPAGDRFGERPDGLTVAKLMAAPHGVDLGPMRSQVPGVLRTPEGVIDLAPPLLVDDLPRLEASIDRARAPMVLIGRRHLRSNNSWMHNVASLIKGPPRCTLLVHPDDAARLGLRDGGAARIASRVGAVVAPVEVTDEVMPGVVSLPHGFGHDVAGARNQVARAHAGVNVNLVSDDLVIDAVSGNAAFNGTPVTVTAA